MAMGRLPRGVGDVGELFRVADELFGEREGERRDAVDDDEGVADDGGLDGGGAAGDDGGAGVVEGFAGGSGTRVRRGGARLSVVRARLSVK